MQPFHYKNNQLYVEEIRLADIADRFGTPCYVYSRNALENNWRAFDSAFAALTHQVCYAVKANSNLAILNLFAKLGSGFDIVSQGELERVITAGGDVSKIIFSGVGKKADEIIRALKVGISHFDVESEAELEQLQRLAQQENKVAKIALRINPNIDAKTHPYISTGLHENKFGIEIPIALSLCERIKKMPNIQFIGLASHIGSQLTELEPFLEALDCLIDLAAKFTDNGFQLKSLNIGGGLGVQYRDETPPSIQDYATALQEKLSGLKYTIIFEPGRSLVADTCMLLTRVEFLKNNSHKNFAIIDAGMNDLIRPSLYDAWHNIIPISSEEKSALKKYDVVGPVCESADFLGKDRMLDIQAGDLLAVCTVGAYGSSMSSNYNTRPRPAEIMVTGDSVHLIKQRETIQQLMTGEALIPE